ncbi:hypothetical protein L1049_010939 [Liquidambar formosana]|uniref:protein-serine/threonine phosphatase n=1 Tax=Liquidambar formosana TaxID=63359 RepID=A0AAP0RQM1_LIQFO
MPCAVAVASPIFSPSRVSAIFCRTPSSSPKILKLNLHGSPSPQPQPPTTPAPSSSSSYPPSALTLQFHKQLNRDCKDDSGSGALLKRKRPARINIPVEPLSFGVDSPVVSNRLNEVVVEGEGYSVYCKRGRRAVMEDRYSSVVDLQGDSKQAFFGVFDGHGGPKAAEFAANNMVNYIMDQVTRRGEGDIVEAIRDGYLTTDAGFLKEDVNGGTCCVSALIHKGDLVVSNAGDCRAVMSRGGIAEALTSDHRPSRTDERERIKNLGGYVDCCHGVWRIEGSLAVSRGIGDRNLKQWVIAEPETTILRIRPEFEFLILASDGLWDKVTNQEAVDVVRPLCVGIDKPEPFSACKKLADLSVRRGSTDDISVMVIQLCHFVN